MRGRLVAIPLLALTLLLSALPSASSVLPGNRFQVEDLSFYLSGDTADAPGAPAALLLSPEAPAAQQTQNFLAPGVSALGLLDFPSTQAWYSQGPWAYDMEITDSVTGTLYFLANAQATSVFELRIYDVAPTGEDFLLASQARQFVTALSPTPVDYTLDAQGLTLQKGHVLRLEVFAQTANALVVLQYGGDTPSGISTVHVRYADSDGDGFSDSDEALAATNPLDPASPGVGGGADADKDGLTDSFERAIGTNPNVADSDGDGFGDGLEVHAGSNPRDPLSKPYDKNTNGLPDSFEQFFFNSTTLNAGVNPDADPDGDDCSNLREALYGTNPTVADSDGDGVADCDEIAQTLNLSSIGPRGVPEPVAAAAGFAIGTSLALVALLRRP